MGHHLTSDGRFQSDKYPELPPNKIVLSFNDPAARVALLVYVLLTEDRGLAEDLRETLSHWGMRT